MVNILYRGLFGAWYSGSSHEKLAAVRYLVLCARIVLALYAPIVFVIYMLLKYLFSYVYEI